MNQSTFNDDTVAPDLIVDGHGKIALPRKPHILLRT